MSHSFPTRSTSSEQDAGASPNLAVDSVVKKPELFVFQQDGDVYRTRRAIVGSVFNDQSFLVDKPANGVRMFCLGGSSSYGYWWI